MPLKPLHIDWVQESVLADLPSPSLVIGLDAVHENVSRMLAATGGPQRLRPHVKTHKLPGLVQRQIARGIQRFKCATIAEAEMCARADAPDVLIAYQLVGPNIPRLLSLQKKYPNTKFSALVDNVEAVRALANAAAKAGAKVEILIDLNVGQNRTGIVPGPGAVEVYREIAKSPSLIPGGLHAYDGHLSQEDAAVRSAECEAAFAKVAALRKELQGLGLPVPRIVAGGSPTFPFHSRRTDVESSPGTTVLWDASSALTLPDMDFKNAAVLLTRVVSKPMDDMLCLDLGHKAVASEMQHPRIIFPKLPDAQGVKHSEEHLVVRTALAAKFAVGDLLLGIPWHVCPSVALHAEAVLVEGGKLAGSWPIEARTRKITV